jgi:hypothetical protein
MSESDIIAKLDELARTNRNDFSVMKTEMTAEIKHFGDVTAVELRHMKESLNELRDDLRECSDANTQIFTRLVKLEEHCAVTHRAGPSSAPSGGFDTMAQKWFHSQAGKGLLWGASIAVAVILTHVVKGFLGAAGP